MINWNAVPMTFNEAWSYMEMLGKLITQVQRDHDLITDIDIDSEAIHENTEAILALEETLRTDYYTKSECDNLFPKFDDVYTVEEALNTFATLAWANAADRRINALEDRVGTRKGVYLYHLESTGYELSAGGVAVTVTKPVTDYDAIEVRMVVSATVNGTPTSHILMSCYCPVSMLATDRLIGIDLTGTGNTFTVSVTDAGYTITAIDSLDVIVYLADTPVTPAIKQEYYAKADADGDNKITEGDARWIQQFAGGVLAGDYTNNLAGWEQWLEDNGHTVTIPVFPDADRDGVVTMSDANLVLQYCGHVLAGDWEDTVDNWYLYSTGQNPQ